MFYKQVKSHGAHILLVITIATINQTLLKSRYDGAFGIFLNYYFNDVLAAMLILLWTNFLLSLNGQRLDKYSHIFILTFTIAIFWEYVTPLYNVRSTSDIWDVAAYLAGGAIYMIYIHLTKRKP